MNIDVVFYQLTEVDPEPHHEQLRQVWTAFRRYDMVSPYLPTVEMVYLERWDRFHVLRTGHLANYLSPQQRAFLEQLKTYALVLLQTTGCKKPQ